MKLDIIPCIGCPYHKARQLQVINQIVEGCTNKQVNVIHFMIMKSKGGECAHRWEN